MFGVGFKGELRPLQKKVIEKVNDIKVPKIAIDVPSGLNSDNAFQIYKEVCCFKAHLTIAVLSHKVGMLLHAKTLNFCGEIRIASLDVGKIDLKANHFLLEKSDILSFITPRKNNTHKYYYGKVLVIAGSESMPGAAALCTNAAIKMGAGIVYLLSTTFHNAILPEIIRIPLKSSENTNLLDNIDFINSHIKDTDAIVIGPGLGTDEDTLSLIKTLVVDNADKH